MKKYKKQLVGEGTVLNLFLTKYVEPENNALILENLDGSPWATASINIGLKTISEDLVFIKDYSENEGIFDLLKDNGVVKELVGICRSEYVDVPVIRIDLNEFEEFVESDLD